MCIIIHDGYTEKQLEDQAGLVTHYEVNILETVPKKMRLVFWALADLLLIFCKFGIKYIKSFRFSAFK